MQQRFIAMWSGPRNISTAMMRSWGSRSDTFVIDEPFYAHYLQHTNYPHPDADKIIAHYETDWQVVVESITSSIPCDKQIYYQKHMTHHILDHMDKSWMLPLTNCFLIRDPRRMILSFTKVIPNPTVDQMGLRQQVDIFEYIHSKTGKVPPVIQSKDVLLNPLDTLSRLCDVLDVPFDKAMLSWEKGRRETDGIWADHWYASVEDSTEFMPYQEDNRPIPDYLQPLLEECQDMYAIMQQHCIN